MAFRNRRPGVVVDKASVRLDGMKQIDAALMTVVNYGSIANILTKTEVENQITGIMTLISDYNQLLETATTKLNTLKQKEQELQRMYTRVLKGAIAQFGVDSSEVEVLGGTRLSERKSPVKTKKADDKHV